MNADFILQNKGSEVATIQQQSSVGDAVAALRDHRVGALVISGDGRHIDGILSERDVVRALAEHGAGALDRPVGEVMSTTVVTCTKSGSVEQLMATMTNERIRHVPVVDEEGLLAGIVSIGDVVKARLGELETDNQALFEYIHQGR